MQKKGNIEEKLSNVSNYEDDLCVESTLILIMTLLMNIFVFISMIQMSLSWRDSGLSRISVDLT